MKHKLKNKIGSKLLSVIIFISIFLIIYYINRNNGLFIKSTIDEHYYYVSKVDDKQDVADMLALIKIKILLLIEYLQSHPNKKYKQYVENLVNKIYTVKIKENMSDDNTSYSINKGEELVICVRSKKTGKLHDINLIIYVVLHEISHIMCPEYGHTPLFIDIFKYVTNEAIKSGIYTRIDFENIPQEYCGLTIDSSII